MAVYATREIHVRLDSRERESARLAGTAVTGGWGKTSLAGLFSQGASAKSLDQAPGICYIHKKGERKRWMT